MDLRVGAGLAAIGAASGIILGSFAGAASAGSDDEDAGGGAGGALRTVALGTGAGAALGVGLLEWGSVLGDGGWIPPSTLAYGALWGGAAGLAGAGAYLVAKSLAD